MKHTTLISIVALCIGCTTAMSQGFSDKTNAIQLDFTKPVVATKLPNISWTSPRAEVSNSVEEKISVQAEINSDIKLKTVRVELSSGGETRIRQIALGTSDFSKSITQPMTLMPGENTVKIFVENEKGGIVSSSRVVLSGKDAIADAVDINRKDYALLFATDNYENWNDLVNPINDARTIAQILKDKYKFEVELIENPTLEEINSKLVDYNTKRFNPQDQLFIFFAGHGYFDQTLKEGFLVASNSLKNDPGMTSYMSHLLLRERINNMKAEHIFLAMDACFGGSFDPVLAKSRGEDVLDEAADKQYLVKKLTKRTRKFLTSGSIEYVSDGVAGKHSPFAEKFILALKEIGGGTGRILSLLELHPYFLKLASEPRFGSFGSDDPASDFVFVAK